MQVKFSKEKNGYNRAEVDRYIELLRAEYVKACEKYAELGERLKETEDARGTLTDTMVTVGNVSTLVEQRAKEGADRMLAEARVRADQILADAYAKTAAVSRAHEVAQDSLRSIYNMIKPLVEKNGGS
jgi:DivIVA domain-containing protein